MLYDIFTSDIDAFDVSNAFRTALGRFVNESSMADMSEVVLASEPPPIDPSRLPELQEKAKQRREQKQKIKDLFALLNGKTGAQAARELQNVVITDKGYRDLAGAVAARLESLESAGLTNTVKIIEVGDKASSRFANNSGVLGTWQGKPFSQPYEATVYLAGHTTESKSCKAEETSLHELVHAATENALAISRRPEARVHLSQAQCRHCRHNESSRGADKSKDRIQ